MRKLSIQGRHDQGASAVEFAIVSIVLVLLLTGILQFGYTFFQYLEVVHAAREGARWASLGVEPGSVGDSESVRGRVSAAAPGLAPGLTDAQIRVAEESVAGQQAVTVGVEYLSPVFVPLIGDIVGGSGIALRSAATLRME
ncbi:MAG: pilus assembly protein [Actinobacteria bacterium]|nr:pilus assembly protein [Actinomycetota bacterium]MCG2807490.1 pilus assembly protein [Coriobacteriia bacterium]